MILTQCPVCAAELPPLSAKQCSRCKTRYCGAACQKLHWKGGHKALCPQIDRGGGAEQYHADTKYTEAVVVAAEACAEDTKGQTCYICLEAVHPRTGEGLVRGCACGDRDGVASGSTGIRMKKIYVEAFLLDRAATPDEFREAVTMSEDTERTAQRVLGGAHPFALDLARAVKVSRAALFIRETQPAEDLAEEVD